ncbi:threonylcarbamoyl-AMP synthase [Paludibacter sp. 221]|nr:threonylcarbamoyl-AMP synthase [Paludibacter sp. 221]
MNDEIKKAIEMLRAGGVILYPTDTVWGLGCDATNEEAVKKVYEIKKREDSKSMLVLLDSTAKLPAYVDEVPDIAWDLIELSDKPLTIIYPEARNLAKNLVAEDKSIGIRITSESFSKTLCERFRKPVVSSSANISGESTPANFMQISDEIKNSVDYIVNFRQDESTLPAPSSIIKLGKGNVFQIIRK